MTHAPAPETSSSHESASHSQAQGGTAAVVTCVEAGYLETQTLRMIESLRNWGGKLANIPVIAVTPRFGSPIQRSTRRRYDKLGVTYVRTKATSPYAWYNFMNKPASLLAAERAVSVDTMIWLDADILVVGEPAEFLLAADEDFAACPTEKNVATTGPDDPYHSYWVAMCRALGMSVEDLPWVTEFREKNRIRAYFNGGVICYRPASGYAAAYQDACEKIMDARIVLPKDSIFYHEQAAVGLAAFIAGLRWRVLADSHNYHFGSKTLQFVDPEQFRKAKVLHYHRSMRTENWPKFLKFFDQDYPQVRAWLDPWGPLADNLPLWKRAVNKLVRQRRQKLTADYRTQCTVVGV